MARICSICRKRRSVGHNVSHSNNRTKRLWRPNLQKVHAKVDGQARHILVCTQCIHSGMVEKVA